MTNWHPTEEDLVLHFYGETGPDEERRVDDHLASCSACRQSWTELGETLKLVDAATVPEPNEGFERVMWARVQQALPEPEAPRSVMEPDPRVMASAERGAGGQRPSPPVAKDEALGAALEREVALVEEAVMAAAELDEVLELRLAAVGPVLHVVAFGEARAVAAREAAAADGEYNSLKSNDFL